MRDKIYLVKHSIGSYEDYHVIDIFATQSKETADRYVEKFNRILEHWIDYMKDFQDKHGFRDAEKCNTTISYRYYDIIDTGKAFIEEIEIR
jgi:hypothetical protein